MAVNVRQTLLQDPEQRKLEWRRKPAQVFRHIKTRLDAAPCCETLHVPLGGRGKTRFIQQGWMQKVRDGASLGHGLI